MTKRKSIFLGKSELHFNDQSVKGETVTLEGESILQDFKF